MLKILHVSPKALSAFFRAHGKTNKVEDPLPEEISQPELGYFKEIQKPVQKQKKTTFDYCQDFKVAISRGDGEMAGHALKKAMSRCPSRNSYCGDELFCPDCPLGGLPVRSGRDGL